jgi:nicotinamide-nucleotide amidase
MKAEIITIGDELLIGQTIDTNSAWLGAQLSAMGIELYRKTAIKDGKQDILDAVSESLARVNLLIITGGLGPTKDDITKKTLAEYYGSGMRRDEEVLAHLTKIFRDRGREMLESNMEQADVPEACQTLFNNHGTAPGMWFEKDGQVIISMPGVPNEMKGIFVEMCIPKLQNTFTLPYIVHMTMVVLGIPESLLSRKLETIEMALPAHIKLAYLPAYNVIRLRLTGYAKEKGDLNAEMGGFFDKIATACGEHVLVRQDVEPMTYLSQWLIEKNISIAAAESCSGGMIAQSLVRNAGISAIYNGSINSYSNDIKVTELGVKSETLAKYGAVSEECALEMAAGARLKFGAQLGISTTGIAGPDGGTDDKKVGLIYLAITDGENHMVKKLHLFGNRGQFMERSVNAMAFVIHLFLQKYYRTKGY